jgi:hypothetical protein
MMRQLLFWAALSFGAGLPMMLSYARVGARVRRDDRRVGGD